VISPSEGTVPDKAQHSNETYIHVHAGFEPTIPASKRP